MTKQEPFIKVDHIQKNYIKKDLLGRRQEHLAVDDVSLEIYKGETLGLVGESGSGKTTLSKIILGLETPTKGSVEYIGLTKDELDSQALQVIYQDPFSALNPYLSAVEIVKEPLYALSKQEAETLALAVLDRVGIKGEDVHKRPGSFSGGQRQRIGIARAVVSRPQFIVCDEPTSALDVSIQSQILELLAELQQELQLSYLFISHDLTVVEHFSNRIAVLYKGQLVELARSQDLFQDARHPYTRYLLAANLSMNPAESRKQLQQISSHVEEFELTDEDEWVEVADQHFVRQKR